MTQAELEAPIAAVTVYPDGARVTRRGRITLPAGEHKVVLNELPPQLVADSVRVSGQGAATVLGVDVGRQWRAHTGHAAAETLLARQRELQEKLAELSDADEVAVWQSDYLDRLGRRTSVAYAKAIAAGKADSDGVAAFGDAMAAKLTAIRDGRREQAGLRRRLTEQLEATTRELSARDRQRAPDRMAVTVSVAAAADGEVTLEVSYVVDGAGWDSVYDIRMVDEKLSLTWYALIKQGTTEDWPECDLRLCTARPSATVAVPELDPWFLDIHHPAPVYGAALARGGPGGPQMFDGAPLPPPAMAAPAGAPPLAQPMAEAAATFEQGAAAATYTPARGVAVPADGGAHRATVAVLDLDGELGYVTAPVTAAEAHVRAVARNTSPHTLRPGKASVFHGNDFVGTTRLETWAPGEEVELALGIDDRVRVERELVQRTAAKARLGQSRRLEVGYKITITNHTGRAITVTVLDQLPVSRHESITVREVRIEPEPAERTDLGVLTWRLRAEPGTAVDMALAFRVDVGKSTEWTGWRE